MKKLNQQTKKFIQEYKQISQNTHINKQNIVKYFNIYTDKLLLSRKPVEIYDYTKGLNKIIDIILTNIFSKLNDYIKTNNSYFDSRMNSHNIAETIVFGLTEQHAWNSIIENEAFHAFKPYSHKEERNNVLLIFYNSKKIQHTNDIWDFIWNNTWNIVKNYAYPIYSKDIFDCVEEALRYTTTETISGVIWYAVCINSCNKNDNCPICQFRRTYCEPIYQLWKNGVFVYWILKDKIIAITRPTIKQVNSKLHKWRRIKKNKVGKGG